MGLFSSKRVINVQNNITFINNNQKTKNLQNICLSTQNHNLAWTNQELDSLSRGGEYSNLDAYYGRGLSGSWSGGLAEVTIQSTKILQNTEEEKEDFKSMNPDVDGCNFDFLSIRVGHPTEVEAGDIEVDENSEYYIFYYRVMCIDDGESEYRYEYFIQVVDNQNHLIFEKYREADVLIPERLDAYPIVPLIRNKTVLSPFVYDGYKSTSGSNYGHSLIPKHLRTTYLDNNPDKKIQFKEQINARNMLNLLNIDYDQIIDNFIDSSKIKRLKVSDEQLLSDKLTEWNSNHYNETEDSITIWINEQNKSFAKMKVYTLGPNEDDNWSSSDYQYKKSMYDEYIKHNINKAKYFKDTGSTIKEDDKTSFFLSAFDFEDEESTAEERLDNINSLFISISLDPFSKHQAVLKALFLYFEYIESILHDDENIFRITYEEGAYNKQIEFTEPQKEVYTETIDRTTTRSNTWFSYNQEDNHYEIKKTIFISEEPDDKLLVKTTSIKFKNVIFKSLITEDGLSKYTESKIGELDSEGKISIPLTRYVYNKMFPHEKNQLAIYCVTTEMYISDITKLKWYQTKLWANIFRIGIYVYEAFVIVGTLGAGAGVAEITAEILKQIVIRYLVKRSLEILISNVNPDLAKVLALLYTAYEIYNLDVGGSNLYIENITKVTSVLSDGYMLQKQIELKEIIEDQNKLIEDRQQAERELKEFREDNGLNDDSTKLDPMKIEPPEEFYNRTMQLSLNLPTTVEGWYNSKLRVFD